MNTLNKYFSLALASIAPSVSASFASDSNTQQTQTAAQEPERTGSILQLRDSLLFTRNVSVDIGFNSASESISTPEISRDAFLLGGTSSGFANSLSLGVRTPVRHLFNLGLSARWSEPPGSSSMRFGSAAVAISKSFNVSPTDSFSLVANYGYSRPSLTSNETAKGVGASASWFRSLDPVVIGLGFGHQQQLREIRVNGLRYRQGDSSSLSATMAFAINDQMSLALTTSAARTGSSLSANNMLPRQSAVNTALSFGYAPTRRESFFVSSNVGNSGGSTSLGLGVTYTRRFF